MLVKVLDNRFGKLPVVPGRDQMARNTVLDSVGHATGSEGDGGQSVCRCLKCHHAEALHVTGQVEDRKDHEIRRRHRFV